MQIAEFLSAFLILVSLLVSIASSCLLPFDGAAAVSHETSCLFVYMKSFHREGPLFFSDVTFDFLNSPVGEALLVLSSQGLSEHSKVI